MFKFWKKKATGREKTKVHKEECGKLTKNTIEISGVSKKAGNVIESVIRNMESGKVKSEKDADRLIHFNLGYLCASRSAGVISKETEEALAEMVVVVGGNIKAYARAKEAAKNEENKEEDTTGAGKTKEEEREKQE